MSSLHPWLKIAILYFLAFGCSFLATRYLDLEFLWAIYISLAAAANFLLFDELIGVIDFREIAKQEGLSKSVYVLAAAVLAGCFAIASALFLK